VRTDGSIATAEAMWRLGWDVYAELFLMGARSIEVRPLWPVRRFEVPAEFRAQVAA
jgi:hypothetical protein